METPDEYTERWFVLKVVTAHQSARSRLIVVLREVWPDIWAKDFEAYIRQLDAKCYTIIAYKKN